MKNHLLITPVTYEATKCLSAMEKIDAENGKSFHLP